MNHLSALDALFLQLETPATPMHVGSFMLLDKLPKKSTSPYQTIRRHLLSRLHLVPLFSRKLAFMPFDLANPIWLEVNRDAIDLDWHIRCHRLPSPGTRQQLEAAIASLHEGMLDRDRPLWQFTVIEGLASGETGFYAKIHHAGLDGQGGVALAQVMFDLEPNARRVPSAKAAAATAPPPSAARLITAALQTSAMQYTKILKAVPGALKTAGAMAVSAVSALSSSQAKKLGAPTEQLAGTGGLLAGVAKLKSTDTPLQAVKKLLPVGVKLGPRTPLNVAITGKRAFMTARLPLGETRELAKFFEVKVNDIILAICAGALRRYFAGDKVALAKSMMGAVPASLRAPGDTTQNNQVTMMLVNLATNIADPAKRIQAIRASSQSAKETAGAMKGTMSAATSQLPTLGIPWLMSVLTPLYKSAVAANRIPVLANVVISNVPGPAVPLYMAGARLLAYYPVSIVTHGLALNITIHSYDGQLDYGVIAAKKEVPGLGKFIKAMHGAHQELMQVMSPPTPVKKVPAGKKTVVKSTQSTKAKRQG